MKQRAVTYTVCMFCAQALEELAMGLQDLDVMLEAANRMRFDTIAAALTNAIHKRLRN